MLKNTKKELEKISGIEKYLFIGKGTRGGVSYIAKRYAKANNKYMNDYDPEKPSTFITYLDKNKLVQKNLLFLVICFLLIVQALLMNMT